jgi:hypothetical protein
VTALWEPVKAALAATLQEYGAGVALLVAAVIALFFQLDRSWRARIKDKDEEIRRMAESRRALEEIVLKNRRSSGPPEDRTTPPTEDRP